MSFPRYPKYKASGVEWLGNVPDGWKVVPCRNIVQEQTAKNDDAKCQNYLSLMANVGVLPYAEKGDVGNKKPEDLSKCKIVRRGDFVINSMNYGIGSYGLSNFDGICSPVYIVLKPKNDMVESRFAFRVFECRSFQQYAQSFGNGILEHRSAINWDILKSIGVGLPCLQEQREILEFLDRETGKIDGLVAEQRRLIELLKEKRQAVISRAVTKGLDPHASMKPSGIKWLGDVPEGWKVKRLRFVADLNPSKTELSKTDRGTAASFLPMEAIGDDGTLILDKEKTVGELDSGYTYFRDGDITIAKITPCFENGKGAIARGLTNGIGFGTTELIVVRPTASEITSKYLYYLFNSIKFRKIGESHMYGAGGQKRVPDNFVKNFVMGVPPLSEQTFIVEFLDSELAKIDTLTTEAQRAIDLLQERRTALISAAVTGQIDVRNSLRN